MPPPSTYFYNHPSRFIPRNTASQIFDSHTPLIYHQSLSGYAPGPALQLPALAQALGLGSICVKDESDRLGLHSFKALGASYAIHCLLQENPDIQVFCSASAGNHGKAVARFASDYGKQAILFVPQKTKKEVIDTIRQLGATVIQLEKNYDETCLHAREISQKNGWTLVQDTAWENYERIPSLIMAGYLSQMYELESQIDLSAIDLIFLQVGVGSWAASIVWYLLKYYASQLPSIVLVEPMEANGMMTSIRLGKPVEPSCSFNTIMAGLNCGIPSLQAFDLLKNSAQLCLSIDDQDTQAAMKRLAHPLGDDPVISAGPSGAAGMAGLSALLTQAQLEEVRQKLGIHSHSRILLFNTEGHPDKC